MPAGWVTIAVLVKARGIRGEISAANLSSGAGRFEGLENGRLFGAGCPPEGRPVVVESAWDHGGRVILKFSGVDSMSIAETLAGLELCVPETERPPAPEGEYYQSDLFDCELWTRSGTLLGKVTGLENFGGPSLLEVRTPAGKELLVPFVRSLLVEVDLPGKRLVMDPPEGLTEL